MSLLNKASLILSPNAVKESKLYSIIPNNGNGDMSVVRATTATRVNELGFIENTPYNLLTYSEQFDNSIGWFVANTTITANTITSPNGTLTADTLTGNGISNIHYLGSATTISIGTIYTMSVYAKKGTNNFLQIAGGTVAFGSSPFANFDLNTGTIGTIGSTSTASITDVGNGWYRCSVTMAAIANSTVGVLNILVNSATSTRLESNTLSTSVYIWGAQVVQGSTPKDYFYTTDRLNVPRLNYDVAGGCPSILLEPQRTNLLLNSVGGGTGYDTFGSVVVTNNFANSPDNTITATRINASAGAWRYRNANTTSLLPNTTYTFTLFAKSNTSGNQTFRIFLYNANFSANLVATPQWQKFTFTSTSLPTVTQIHGIGADTLNNSADIQTWGWQIELGAYPTSYIPTIASTVTRNADVISKTGISSLIGQTEGTLFIQFSVNTVVDTSKYIGISDGTASNRVIIGLDTFSASFRFYYNSSAGTSLNYTGANLSINTIKKIAVKYAPNTLKLYIDGILVYSSTSVNTFTSNNLTQIGLVNSPDFKIYGIYLFPTALTDTECIAITT